MFDTFAGRVRFAVRRGQKRRGRKRRAGNDARWRVKPNSSVTNDGRNFRSFCRGGRFVNVRDIFHEPLRLLLNACLAISAILRGHKRVLSRAPTLSATRLDVVHAVLRRASEAIDDFSLVELLSPSCTAFCSFSSSN